MTTLEFAIDEDIFAKEISIVVREFDLMLLLEAEGASSRIMDGVIKFFKDIIEKIKEFSKTIIEKVRRQYQTVEFKKELKQMHAAITAAANKGEKVEFYDVYRYTNEYKKFSEKVTKHLDKLMAKENWEAKMTPEKAESLIKESEDICKHYDKVLTEIRTKKVKMDPIKLLVWIENSIGDVNGVDVLADYTKAVEDSLKRVEQLKKDLEKYSEETGYVIHARTVKEHINNSMIYIRKNSDWLSYAAVSGALTAISVCAKAGYIAHEIGKDKLTNPAYIQSDNMQEDLRDAGNKFDESKVSLITKAADAAAAGSSLKATLGQHDADKSGRNSIYSVNKKSDKK